MNNKITTILFLVGYFLLLATPIIVAYWRWHPRRHYIAALTLVSVAVCIGPIPCLIWACWPIPFKLQFRGYEFTVRNRGCILGLMHEPANEYAMVRALVSPYLGQTDASLWPTMRTYIQRNPNAWAKQIFRALNQETTRLKRRTLNEEDVQRVLGKKGKQDAERIARGKAPRYVATAGSGATFLKWFAIPGAVSVTSLVVLGCLSNLHPGWGDAHPILVVICLVISGGLGFFAFIGLILWLKTFGTSED